MIDWSELIRADGEIKKAEITSKSRACPTTLDDEFEKVGQLEPNDHNGFKDSARLARPARLKNEGEEQEQINNPPVEGVASDNYRAAKTHPVNPIAICLLLTCCNKAEASKEEIFEQIWKLQTIPQTEQVRSWAALCQRRGIDVYRIVYPSTYSPNKGTSCQGCRYIDMQKITGDQRTGYRFTCKKHHPILEAFYAHERVLIAPESCSDYLPTATRGR